MSRHLSSLRVTIVITLLSLFVHLTTHANPQASDRRVAANLVKPVSIDDDQIPLKDVLDLIRESTGVIISVDWKSLELSSVDQESHIDMHLKNAPAEVLLKYALEQASADAFDNDRAGFTIYEGKVRISTRGEIKKSYSQTHRYDMRKVLDRFRDPFDRQIFIDNFTYLISGAIGQQDEWLDEKSTIEEVNDEFVITTTWNNHLEINDLLSQLNKPIRRGSSGESRADHAVATKLKKKIAFEKNPPTLGEAIDTIRAATRLHVIVNWEALELVSIKKDDRLANPIKSASGAEMIEQVLKQASSDAIEEDKASFAIDDGLVIISTIRELNELTHACIYNISHLIKNDESIDALVEKIEAGVGDQDEWNGGTSVVTEFQNLLVVKTTTNNHRQVEELISSLR